jgi:hypothetical protein
VKGSQRPLAELNQNRGIAARQVPTSAGSEQTFPPSLLPVPFVPLAPFEPELPFAPLAPFVPELPPVPELPLVPDPPVGSEVSPPHAVASETPNTKLEARARRSIMDRLSRFEELSASGADAALTITIVE